MLLSSAIVCRTLSEVKALRGQITTFQEGSLTSAAVELELAPAVPALPKPDTLALTPHEELEA